MGKKLKPPSSKGTGNTPKNSQRSSHRGQKPKKGLAAKAGSTNIVVADSIAEEEEEQIVQDVQPVTDIQKLELLQELRASTSDEIKQLEGQLRGMEQDSSLEKQLGMALEQLTPAAVIAAWDKNRDKEVSKIEFKQAIRNLNLKAKNVEIEGLFDRFGS